MIQLSRNYSLPEQQDDLLSIKVIGVGGAGLNVLDPSFSMDSNGRT